MKQPSKHLFWILALVAAVSFDQLFWEKPGGINFFIFVLVAILGGLIPLWLEKVHIPWASYLLLAPIAFFALMTFFRAEPFTNLLNGALTLGSLVLFFITLLNGAWIQFNLWDHLVNLFKFAVNCFSGGILFFLKVKKEQDTNTDDTGADANIEPEKPQTRPWAPYIRGILLAVPVLIVLAALLASADPVFDNHLRNLFSWFKIENLGTFLFRMVYIIVIAYLLLSAYFFGSVESQKWQKDQHAKPLTRPFLGAIEANIVLGAINLLFLLFVVLQFTYLFGGARNITVEGFTYAEYARRGFFELLVVVLISLVLFYALSVFTRRETKSQRWVFSGMGLLLVGLVGIILASAYTRLTLYEAAYGFTRLRTVTHIFMVWTGLLLLAIGALEITRHMDRLAFALIVFMVGFGVSVNLLNIDRLIVRQNVNRVLTVPDEDLETALDAGYLYTLSDDAIPPLVAYYSDPKLPDAVRDSVGGVLACRLATLDQPEDIPWASTHYSRARAASLLQSQGGLLDDYPVIDQNGWHVLINGELRPCGQDYSLD